MPLEAAPWSMISNLTSQVSTAWGCCAAERLNPLTDLPAAWRLETWVSSDDTVIRWLPTIAAAPAYTGEHAAIAAQAPRPAAPSATARPILLAGAVLPDTVPPNTALPNTGIPFQHINDSRNLRLGQYRTDDLRAPREQFGVAQRFPAEAAA